MSRNAGDCLFPLTLMESIAATPWVIGSPLLHVNRDRKNQHFLVITFISSICILSLISIISKTFPGFFGLCCQLSFQNGECCNVLNHRLTNYDEVIDRIPPRVLLLLLKLLFLFIPLFYS